MNQDDQHHRKSIRLKGYDYATAGYYYITICVQDKLHLFGQTRDDIMILNEAGMMIDRWVKEIPKKFEAFELGSYIIMPNHIHAIIINHSSISSVGADLCVCPKNGSIEENIPSEGRHAGLPQRGTCNDIPTEGRHAGLPLPRVVQWFKTMTTNSYIDGVKEKGWPRFKNKLWQRNYYEHIIRNEEDHYNTQQYIMTNPLRWIKHQTNEQEQYEKI